MSASSPQRVILVTHEFYPKRGGIATYAEEMALAAQEMGWQVEVWASDRPGMRNRHTPFPLQPIKNKGSLDWPCRLATASKLRCNGEDLRDSLVYFPEPGPILTMMYAPVLGITRPRKLAITLHGTEILRFSRTPWRKFLFRRFLAHCDRIGVVSDYNRKLLLEKMPSVDASRIRVVPGALRHDFATPPARQRPDDGRVRVITVGRIHPRKGQHYVMQALAALPDALRSKVEYHVVGPVVKEHYANELKAAAQQAGVPVVFVGEVEDADLPQHYADADIFAMTSVQSGVSVEGFGLVYLEAAACGLPVIAHDTGGVAEAVRHEQSGLVVQPDDTEALTSAFARLIESPELRQQMATAGQARAAELSWKNNVAAHFDLEGGQT
ncbi:MAG: glycosyltransferase family 4 protein [Puniceicoccales bacterium]